MNLSACIVETRPEKLQKAIDKHFPFLPKETACYIFGGKEIYNYLFTGVHRRYENVTPSFINLSDSINESYYNTLLTSKTFWETFKSENVLIFQHDSELLRTGIEEFYEWDFIGAPLYHFPHPCMNGGLSLRRKSAMLKVLDKYPYMGETVHGNEDIFFCNKLKQLGGKLPTKETAMKFSVETIYGLGSLGCHSIDKWFTQDQCKEIRSQYKGIEA